MDERSADKTQVKQGHKLESCGAALECHVALTKVDVADDGLDPIEIGGGGAKVADGREEDCVQACAHVDKLRDGVAEELVAKDNAKMKTLKRNGRQTGGDGQGEVNSRAEAQTWWPMIANMRRMKPMSSSRCCKLESARTCPHKDSRVWSIRQLSDNYQTGSSGKGWRPILGDARLCRRG